MAPAPLSADDHRCGVACQEGDERGNFAGLGTQGSKEPDVTDEQPGKAVIDTTRPHQARVYNYWLGGKENFAVDREAAERALAAYPGLRRGVRAQRAFLANVVGYLARSQGIRQFLDVGSGTCVSYCIPFRWWCC
jgi:hypothetical protein